MLIVDAQVHIWKNNKPANPAHRQVSEFLARLGAGPMTRAVEERP